MSLDAFFRRVTELLREFAFEWDFRELEAAPLGFGFDFRLQPFPELPVP